jgi:hypothetical protein
LNYTLYKNNYDGIIIAECWPDHVAKQQVNKGRAKGVATNTPKKDIMNEMKSYHDIQLIHEHDNPYWKVKEVFENNNGLTILEKIQ